MLFPAFVYWRQLKEYIYKPNSSAAINLPLRPLDLY